MVPVAIAGRRRTGFVEQRHLIEDDYSVADAVVVGSLLDLPAAAQRPRDDRLPGPTRQRHRADPHRARRTGLAAGDLRPVRTDGPLRHGRGAAPGDRFTAPRARLGSATSLRSMPSRTLDDDAGACTVIVVNRSPVEPVAVTVVLPSGSWQPGMHHHMEAASVDIVNTAAHPDRVRAGTSPAPRPQEGHVTVVVPAASWHLLRYASARRRPNLIVPTPNDDRVRQAGPRRRSRLDGPRPGRRTGPWSGVVLTGRAHRHALGPAIRRRLRGDVPGDQLLTALPTTGVRFSRTAERGSARGRTSDGCAGTLGRTVRADPRRDPHRRRRPVGGRPDLGAGRRQPIRSGGWCGT